MYVDHTGHYAATDKTSEGRTRLLRSADQLKDQTYYLSSCSESQLSRVSFVPPSSPRFCNACSVQLNPPKFLVFPFLEQNVHVHQRPCSPSPT
jgi:hypothetical protein